MIPLHVLLKSLCCHEFLLTLCCRPVTPVDAMRFFDICYLFLFNSCLFIDFYLFICFLCIVVLCLLVYFILPLKISHHDKNMFASFFYVNFYPFLTFS